MPRILPVLYRDDILPEYRGTPVGLLLEYHNLGRAVGSAEAPQVLIGMCMDSRKSLRIPNDFAFVLRTAGANMRDNEFRISYAIAVGGVRTIVLIAHTDCGMARLAEPDVKGVMLAKVRQRLEAQVGTTAASSPQPTASGTASQVSRTSSIRRRPTCSASVSSSARPGSPRTARTRATASTSAPSAAWSAASTNQTPSAYAGSSRSARASA